MTHFAAPPVLMVSRTWEWGTPFMLGHFGWRAATAIAISTLAYYLFFRQEFASLNAKRHRPDADIAAEAANGPAVTVAGPCMGHARACGFHGVDRRQRALPRTVRRRLSLLHRVCPRDRRLSGANRHEDAAARRLLPRRPRHPRRIAGMVDCARAREPVAERPVLGRDRPDGIQRQRADHLPRDARPQSQRRVQDRGRRGRGDRRRADGHRERAESRRPGVARPLFRQRDQSASGCSRLPSSRR